SPSEGLARADNHADSFSERSPGHHCQRNDGYGERTDARSLADQASTKPANHSSLPSEMKPRVKHVVQLLLLAFALWALWPTAQRVSSAPGKRVSLNPQAKYVIRVAPDLYTPGTMPQNVGKPLVGFNQVADDFEKLLPDTRIEFVSVPSGQRE